MGKQSIYDNFEIGYSPVYYLVTFYDIAKLI